MRLLILVGLLCATASRAGGSEPASDEARSRDRNLKEVYQRAVELKEAAVRQGMELQALRKAYESDPDPARFAARRETARLELSMTLDSLEIIRKKYLVLGSALVYTRALDAVARKPDAPIPGEGDFLDMTSVNRFDKLLQRTHRGWERAMKEEAPAFSNLGREADRTASLVRAATAFRHPLIEEVREVGVSADGVFLVLEPCVGRPLADVLGAGKPLGLTAVMAVMAPVARALDAAHAAGFVHGSLTPERVLILPDGSGRLTDFGLARALANRQAARGRVFSPAYAAPEVMEGKIRLASDLYAFGVVFYEMLFVRLPFEGPNLAALKQERRFPAPSALLGRAAPRVDAFFAGLLEPSARRRRPPVGGLAASLAAFGGEGS